MRVLRLPSLGLLWLACTAIAPYCRGLPRHAHTEAEAKAGSTRAIVTNGLDLLLEEPQKWLAGRRVGLITNRTGVDRNGQLGYLRLARAKGVRLVALFSPEHGLYAKRGGKVQDAKEERTGLPIRSLYGATRKPSKEQLADIDTLVFDIQDIGTRFYTYISTMGLAMEAAAETKKRFVVLDRPNPLGGMRVSGPMLDDELQSFVGFHSLPIRHGMTVGELARMFRSEKRLDLDLVVVPMRGWRRSMFFEATGQPFVPPSPNMRSMNEALLYPGIGLLEFTNLSVGRGTSHPFERIGAPWIKAEKLWRRVHEAKLEGFALQPMHFVPTASKFKGEPCHGLAFTITDRRRFDPLRVGLEIACALRDLFPRTWEKERYLRLLGNREVYRAFLEGKSPERLYEMSQQGLGAFLKRRKGFLLYDAAPGSQKARR